VPPPDSEPFFELFFEELFLELFIEPPVSLPLVFLLLAADCELLPEVVELVSLLLAQEARNATPRRQTIDDRMDFFIGLS
jgi:hypothetical protein